MQVAGAYLKNRHEDLEDGQLQFRASQRDTKAKDPAALTRDTSLQLHTKVAALAIIIICSCRTWEDKHVA
jgi:hypothetical protein